MKRKRYSEEQIAFVLGPSVITPGLVSLTNFDHLDGSRVVLAR
jgi:hypothetical protein